MLWCLTSLSTLFEPYFGVSFIGGGNWSARRKTKDLLQLTDKLNYLTLCRAHLAIIGIRTHNMSGVVYNFGDKLLIDAEKKDLAFT